MIFINNKYTKWYFQIIENAKDRETIGYSERHHILPRCLNGGNERGNLIRLTAREHFICHWLLIKMTDRINRKPLLYALFAMRTGNRKQYRYSSRITSRVYAILTEEKSKLVSIQLTGRQCSPETRLKISLSQKDKPRQLHSQETKAKMSESQKSRAPDSVETRHRKSLASTGNVPSNKGIPMAEEQKIKLRKPKPPRTAEHIENLKASIRAGKERRGLVVPGEQIHMNDHQMCIPN